MANNKKFSFKDLKAALVQKPMMATLVMGFSSGVPYLLASKTLQTWMSYTGGTNNMVGAMALVGLPYSLKFLWSPLLDRYRLTKLGRRRSWILFSQLGIFLSVLTLSFLKPVDQILLTSICALAVSFFGATQDIAVDAYRREILKDEELGLGSSIYSMGYRIANWITGGLALILAGLLSWNTVYLIMAIVMLLTVSATLWADEPTEASSSPKTLLDAVVLPLKDFFSRHGAVLFLIFILLYKVGDAMAGNMLPKFYADLGFTPQEVGIIAKTMGLYTVVVGTFVGGVLIMKLGIYRSLFVFGIFQALSTFSFVILNITGHNLIALTGVVLFEDFSSGLGSAAFMAFMASLTNKSFTGTQYALLTSLMAVPRTVISAFTGPLVSALGWSGFFTFCGVVAIPGLLLIRYVYNQQQKGIA
jgi:MFS transporter, PAT family, beta-lactamase induction signal transducer AmpG